jgi:hypothetical protein
MNSGVDDVARLIRLRSPVRIATVGVVLIVAVYATAGLALAIRALDDRSARDSSISQLDRQYGTWKDFPRIIRDRSVVERARRIMPEKASYRVAIGRRWTPALTTRWTSSLERDFLSYYLLPHRLTHSRETQWVFCLACERATLGTHVEILARGADGMQFLRVEP